MPFEDVVGKTGAVLPEHNGAIAENTGLMLELTVTVNIVVVAH